MCYAKGSVHTLYPESTDVAIQVARVCSSIDAAIVQQKKQAKIIVFAITVYERAVGELIVSKYVAELINN